MDLRPGLLVTLLVGLGCGSGGTSEGAIAWIEIRPGSLLLTAERPSASLEAIAYDADGNQVDADVTWSSSTPDQIAVDGRGRVSAEVELGSATVWAEAGGVASNPVVVAAVELHPGTLVVTDDQVVDPGSPFLPDGAAPDDLPQVDVRLRGVDAPAAGTILVSAEAAPVGGRVISAGEEGGELVVRLQMLTMPELFARWDIDWQIGLAGYGVEGDDPASPLETFALRPVEQKLKKEWPSKGAFRCSASITAFLEKNTVDLKLAGDAEFIFQSSRRDASLPPGYLKVALEGPLTLKGSLALRAKAGLKAKGKCELRGRIPIALGAFAIMVAPAIPLGVGVSLDAKLTAASLELGFEGENGVDLGLGFECGPGTSPCRSLDKLEPINKFKPLIQVPRGMKDSRVDMNAQAYFLSGIHLLFGLGTVTFEAIDFTIGPVQSASLAFVDNQADDRAYASKYELKLEGKLSAGDGVDSAIKKLLGKDEEDGSLGLELTISKPLSKSPVGTLAVDKTRSGVNGKVNLTVELDAKSVVYFLLGYNVTSIEIYRKRDDSPVYEHMTSIAAVSSNQTRFTWEWIPKQEDTGQNEFFAFVKTALPVIELEIGADSGKKVEVVELCGGVAPLAGALPGGGSSCQLNGTMSYLQQATTAGGTVTTQASATVTLELDPDSSPPGLLTFRPHGTWTASHGGTSFGCTVSSSPDPATGTLSGTDPQGAFSMYTGDATHQADHYHGAMATGPFPVTTTLACPDAEPFVQEQTFDTPLWLVFEDQMMFLDPVTRRAVGSYTQTDSDGAGNSVSKVYTWDLVLTGEQMP